MNSYDISAEIRLVATCDNKDELRIALLQLREELQIRGITLLGVGGARAITATAMEVQRVLDDEGAPVEF